jgi:hypothetical protein
LHKEVVNSGLLRESILALQQKARRDHENPKRKQGRSEKAKTMSQRMQFCVKIAKKKLGEFAFLTYLEGTSSIHEYPSLERGGIRG